MRSPASMGASSPSRWSAVPNVATGKHESACTLVATATAAQRAASSSITWRYTS